MDIKNFSTSAGGNVSFWPENMGAQLVNDRGREQMAAVRSWYENAEWVDHGDTINPSTTTSFYVGGDKTDVYKSGRRIKASDGASTLYGVIETSTYSAAGSTGVYCTLDYGDFTSSLSAIAVGIIGTLGGSSLSFPLNEQSTSYAYRASSFEFGDTWSTSATGAVSSNIVIPDNRIGSVYLLEGYISDVTHSSTGTISGADSYVGWYQLNVNEGVHLVSGTDILNQTIKSSHGTARSVFISSISSTLQFHLEWVPNPASYNATQQLHHKVTRLRL